jgi:hypothetical protein
MSRRLDDTDLDNLESAAKGGVRGMLGPVAHPLDVLRLVEEVRWYKAALAEWTEWSEAFRRNSVILDRGAEEYIKQQVTDSAGEVVADVKVPPSDVPVYGPSDLRPWATGTNPDPTIKSSFAKAAEQIRNDCESMTGDETIEVVIPAGTFIPSGTELFDQVIAQLILGQSSPKNDETIKVTRTFFPPDSDVYRGLEAAGMFSPKNDDGDTPTVVKGN